MENFKAILEQQKAALQKDIDKYNEQIKELEGDLDFVKETKSKANSALRSIEKKLAKL